MAFKKNHSPWSKGPFFGLRALQFIFATIVSAIASYFNYTLDADGYEIPWVFLIVEVVVSIKQYLMQVSIATIANQDAVSINIPQHLCFQHYHVLQQAQSPYHDGCRCNLGLHVGLYIRHVVTGNGENHN